jgi:hypothetical protein
MELHELGAKLAYGKPDFWIVEYNDNFVRALDQYGTIRFELQRGLIGDMAFTYSDLLYDEVVWLAAADRHFNGHLTGAMLRHLEQQRNPDTRSNHFTAKHKASTRDNMRQMLYETGEVARRIVAQRHADWRKEAADAA